VDGKVLREISRLRIKPGAMPDPLRSRPAMPTWQPSDGARSTGFRGEGAVPQDVKFQNSIRTPIGRGAKLVAYGYLTRWLV
jgi:hypothetical protein